MLVITYGDIPTEPNSSSWGQSGAMMAPLQYLFDVPQDNNCIEAKPLEWGVVKENTIRDEPREEIRESNNNPPS